MVCQQRRTTTRRSAPLLYHLRIHYRATPGRRARPLRLLQTSQSLRNAPVQSTSITHAVPHMPRPHLRPSPIRLASALRNTPTLETQYTRTMSGQPSGRAQSFMAPLLLHMDSNTHDQLRVTTRAGLTMSSTWQIWARACTRTTEQTCQSRNTILIRDSQMRSCCSTFSRSQLIPHRRRPRQPNG